MRTGGGRGPNVMLVAWMLVAIAGVALLAYWDEQREAEAALNDFTEEQAMLAQALSRALAERLAVVERDALEASRQMTEVGERDAPSGVHVSVRAPADPREEASTTTVFRFPLHGRDDVRTGSVPFLPLFASIRALERPGVLRVLVKPPHDTRWLASSDASTVRAPSLVAPTTPTVRSIRLSRPEAADLGLPARTAIAGIAHLDAGTLGAWDVAVVASAQAERDRERRAEWRLILGVVVAGVLVIAFGSAAVRRQRHQLALTHALEIAALERERDERLGNADKLATMGAFATGIAHEVSTPLGVIVARAEQVVARTGADERTRSAAEIILAQAERIHVVIRGFLALARGHTPRLEETEPAELARAALGLVEHRFSKAGVTLTSRIDDDLRSCSCDPRMFEQVLVNLLLNACEACKSGGTVTLSVRREGERIAFVVDDDGVGIGEEAIARATEPFFTTKPEGTGLGLAITNEIVHHHGGTLNLRPRPTGGTQAIVELPTTSRDHESS